MKITMTKKNSFLTIKNIDSKSENSYCSPFHFEEFAEVNPYTKNEPILDQIIATYGYKNIKLKLIGYCFSLVFVLGLHFFCFNILYIAIQNDFHLTNYVMNFISSAFYLGCAFGFFISACIHK